MRAVERDMADSVTIPAAELAAPKARLAELEAERELERRFRELAVQWREEGGVYSGREMFEVPSYRAIMAMGRPVVPLILRELEQRPDHWYFALRHLTGADPVSDEHRGRLHEMARDWVDWGYAHGLLP